MKVLLSEVVPYIWGVLWFLTAGVAVSLHTLCSFPVSICISTKQHDKRLLKEAFILAYGSKGIRGQYRGGGIAASFGHGDRKTRDCVTTIMKQKARVNQKQSEAKKILKTAPPLDIFF